MGRIVALVWRCLPFFLIIDSIFLITDGVIGGELSLLAILFVAVGVINVVAFMDGRRWTWARGFPGMEQPPLSWPRTALIAQAAALPFFLLPPIIEFNSGVHNLTDVLISSLALILLIIAIIVCFTAISKDTGQILGKAWAILLATTIPLASVGLSWYQTYYKPLHQRPDINILASLKEIRSSGKTARLDATVTLSNDGSSTVDFFDAIYTVTGFDTPALRHQLTPAKFRSVAGDTQTPSADSAGYKGLLTLGHLIAPGGHLVPGQKLLTSVVFAVDKEFQSKLRLTVFLSTVPDTGGLGPFSPCKPMFKVSSCDETALPVGGWLRQSLSDHPRARTSIVYSAHKPPSFRTDFIYGDSHNSKTFLSQTGPGRRLYPHVYTRGFTTSVEFSLANTS